MSGRRNTCCTCRHWSGEIEFAGAVPRWNPGQCRAQPPIGRARWPKTEAVDWCGAHAEHHPDPAMLFATRVAVGGC